MAERRVKFVDDVAKSREGRPSMTVSSSDHEARALQAQKCAIEAMQQARILRTEIINGATSPTNKKPAPIERPSSATSRRSSVASENPTALPKRISSASDLSTSTVPRRSSVAGYQPSLSPPGALNASSQARKSSDDILGAIPMDWFTKMFNIPNSPTNVVE
eukprot:CAMPEP_0113669776 /NCGR_PEP_ID=MMETSP0038_2-20120614/4761_1 /TAXON_ID=2898 /ORGANISM="Cryptomonas paramecium" /LENGTH=161 /DNA_ID=CAMNT_0000585703 /DNA_START=172 /DNA_END=657 /DNA_ORIENTATION=+ /assembly_acc=CAM_ASM_000170